ncbi:MAG: hypothetical protein MK171_08325 [Pirellulales bacterium]|nr:hypothetical protein [Pirellulales bacterium]
MCSQNQPGEESILDSQQELLETSLPLVFAAYDAARKSGMDQPVVLLIDCEDAIGRKIVRSWLGADTVQEAIEYRQLMDSTELAASDEAPGGQTTVFAHAFSLEACRQEVPAVFPYLSSVFDELLPANAFLAIAVTCGGASALTVPLSARDS